MSVMTSMDKDELPPIWVQYMPGCYDPPEKLSLEDPDYCTPYNQGSWTPPKLMMLTSEVARLCGKMNAYSAELARLIFEESESLAGKSEFVTFFGDAAHEITVAIGVCMIDVDVEIISQPRAEVREPNYPRFIAESLR